MKPYKILISGGGTGGHIFPAIAIAKEIQNRNAEAIIEFVGAMDRMEMEKVPAAGYKIHGIWITGFQRKLSFKNLLFPFKVLTSLFICFRILKNFKPSLVIGTGGFASGPLLKIACWMNIPTLIQEQNSYAGITNKLLGKKVDSICLGFEKAQKFFPKHKSVLTGNPIRQSILNLPNKDESIKILGLDKSKKTLLIIGGSLGARSINEAIELLLETFERNSLQIIWQTGKTYTPNKKPIYGFVSSFIDDMERVYSASDFIISRAGAIAISELCVVGKPVILIPSPNVSEDHQTKNALALVEANAALMVKDKEVATDLWLALQTLLDDTALANEFATNIIKLAKPNATKSIVDEVEKLRNK